jgi:hypothetical protein
VDYLDFSCRVLLGTVFTVAVVGKVRRGTAYREFVTSLRGLGWLPSALLPAVAAAVVACEAMVVLLLAVPATGVVGHLLAVLVLGSFSTTVAASLYRGQQVRCRCFGSDGRRFGIGHLVRNGLLMVVGGFGLVAAAAGGTSPRWDLLAAGCAVALLGAGAIVRWDDLAYLIGGQRGRAM